MTVSSVKEEKKNIANITDNWGIGYWPKRYFKHLDQARMPQLVHHLLDEKITTKKNNIFTCAPLHHSHEIHISLLCQPSIWHMSCVKQSLQMDRKYCNKRWCMSLKSSCTCPYRRLYVSIPYTPHRWWESNELNGTWSWQGTGADTH